MKLTDMTITNFAELLASDAPAPGGGSAAALKGAAGVALIGMVVNLTIGKEKYAEYEGLMKELLAETERIRLQFVDAIDRDTEAFNGMAAVFSMPKGTEEEKADRRLAMQKALKECTIPPYEMMCCAVAALELAERALGKSNAGVVSDLGVAALSLKAAVQSAWLNILINIGSIKDEAFAAKYRSEGEDILAKALPRADRIYEAVLLDVS